MDIVKQDFKQEDKMKKFKLNIQLFAEPGEPKTFTQEEVDKMIETRLKRENEKFEKAKKELERQHNESIEDYEERIKNANLTAEEKYNKSLAELQKQLESSNSELATMKTNELKKAALGKYKIPDSFLGSISGNTEEEIENSVKSFSERLSSYLKTQSGGIPNSLNGGSNGEENKKDTGLEAFDKAFSSF